MPSGTCASPLCSRACFCIASPQLHMNTQRCCMHPVIQSVEQGKYVEVTGGEEGLKEALYTKGPMTVSVDAGPEAFRFYKSGVFSESA